MQDLANLLQQQSVFVFDFDGVLVDSVEIKSEAFALLFKEYGSGVVQRVIAHHRSAGGVTRCEKLRYYHAEYLEQNLTDQELAARARQFSELVVDRVAQAPEIPGAEKYLRITCSEKRCFINSATPDNELHDILQRRGWLELFNGVYGSSRSKEQNLSLILDRCKIASDECVFFGDAESDYLAAREADVKFVGVNMPDLVRQKLPGILVHNIGSFEELYS